ncbi:penicillin-binding protein 1A [Polaromonas sp. C04]|uniref:penicillin-binding protein 1A n=1 Tax=Polaromonas sp. C04 TaxID=1945857 RepID=UPI00098466F2|nr:penicillin-binding protein 1A [Polaromonas sp. C04]OOG51483.1 penicillin-binding protein [Polaromonas sp. C04]
MPARPESDKAPKPPKVIESQSPAWLRWFWRLALWGAGLAVAGAAALLMVIAVALAVAYPNLPDIDALTDYRPKLPLRVFTSEGVLIGEYGEERRNLTPIKDIPAIMKDAVLSIEDAHFYQHGGVDYPGVIRAALANLGHAKSQGASTITMQVARNVYLSAEKSYTRKIYEILLTFKLEHRLTKDQILEIYMNQIYLGNRAYGFASACETYFGKPLKDITIAEAAMLAGLPKAPSAYNPINNPARARSRQLYIIERMQENGYITQAQADAAKKEELDVKSGPEEGRVHAEYVAEMVRQLMFAQYGDATYTRGLDVYTTLNAADQTAAYQALRKGIMDFERRQIYRGPEEFIDLPADPKEAEDVIDDALVDHPDNDDLMAAVVLQASAKKITAIRQNGDTIEITGDGLRPARAGLYDKAPSNVKIRRGAVIRVIQTPKGTWEVTQLPEVEGALVAMDPRNGAIKALVGGFDFNKSKFNHVTQAWRQPGSSFKPFIYSSALEKGFTPATIINDAPLFFDAGVTGGQPWEPKNYENTFEGPISLRRALAKSINTVSIRVLQAVGPQYAQDWITRFGFDADKHPAYLTMALGAGSVTPLQMATAYSVFANSGYRVNPYLVTKVTDHRGKALAEAVPPVADRSARVIPARNAFVMQSLLQEVTRSGTGASAQRILKRPDIYGKTGTTNDSLDGWFAGYQPTLTAIAWMGFDTPRSLGDRETGGGVALPIWINFMQSALKGVPVAETPVPEGVVNVAGEWYYDEYAKGAGVSSVGLPNQPAQNPAGTPPTPASPPAPSERQRILDMFKS